MTTVFLIGAARSGTKLVRDLLGEHPDVAVVPYDINYLWRLGSEAVPHDELVAPLPTKAVRGVEAELQKAKARVSVEKTVSNCLRVPAMADAFPEARFILLLRDGLDVTESSMRQWQAPFDWRYSARKALSFPWLRAPLYAAKHLRSSLVRSSSGTATWGPRYDGIDDDVARLRLAEVCARQWSECVTQAFDGFEQVGQRPLVVRYEQLVATPLAEVNRLHTALGLEAVSGLAQEVQSTQVGRGAARLSADDVDLIKALVSETTDRIEAWNSEA